MWVGNVGNALLHFLFSVNNTLSLRQRVQIYLGPTFVERPNEIFKTKLCLTECTPKQFWTKKTTLESWSNNKNPFWSRWGVQTNGSRPSHYINAIPTSHYDLFISWVIFSTDKISLRNGGKIKYYNQTWNLSKNLHDQIFRRKNFTHWKRVNWDFFCTR